jgi:DnaJ domain
LEFWLGRGKVKNITKIFGKLTAGIVRRFQTKTYIYAQIFPRNNIWSMKTSSNYYQILGVAPWASEQTLRDSYRRLCRDYHPDTTTLEQEEALQKFLLLNEAYETLTHPIKRARYDRQLGVLPASTSTSRERSGGRGQRKSYKVSSRKSAPPDAIQERPLSTTEIFALSILGLAFVSCITLVFFVGFIRGM